MLLKQIVREAARVSGFEATFMAKPYPGRIGSGLHIHASIVDDAGANIFDDGSAEGSERLRHAMGGLQALMPESMALFAPSPNSYRRFQPDMFAPVNRRWGVNNRSAGLRIPVGASESRRVEHRVSGAGVAGPTVWHADVIRRLMPRVHELLASAGAPLVICSARPELGPKLNFTVSPGWAASNCCPS